jgi:hypothetical protein
MRLTKDIKNQLITNLLKQAPLGLRAIACMEERRDVVETARLLCLAAEKTTDLEIRDLREKIKRQGAAVDNSFVKVHATVYEVDKDNYHSYTIDFAVGGEVQCRMLDGFDRYYQPGIGRRALHDGEYFGWWLYELAEFEDVGYFLPRERVLLEADPALQARIAKVDAEYRDLFSEVVAWRATMRSNLAAVNTSEKLREVWPDAFPFLPPEAKKETAVALSPETLNALCGLPK